MIDETVEGEESFADLFERSLQVERRQVRPGEKVRGRVVQIGAERALIDLGDGLDAMIELGELAEKGAISTVKVGDTIEAFVLRLEDRLPLLAKSIGKGAGARLALEEGARTGIPVEGLVAEVNKGGYVIDIGGVRCFCPLGQMDIRRIEEPATMIGQRLSFRVQEFRGTRDVVLSRRALLEAEQAARAAKIRSQLEPGARFKGTVTSVRDFGVFVDIGGLEGLIPASELGYGRQRPQDVVRGGETVEVQILRIEPPGPKDRTERITLSMRALAEDPWERTAAELTIGSVVRGTVVRIQPFGAFVEIVPGVDGLLHVSAFGRRVAQPSDVVSVGDSVAVQIEGIEPSQRRISLSYVDPAEILEEEPAAEPVVAAAPAVIPTPATAAPAPKPAPPKNANAPDGPGLRVRRVEKVAKAAAPATPMASQKIPSASATPGPTQKPQVLGRSGTSTPTAPTIASQTPRIGQVVDVTVDKIEPFGLLVRWASSRGLVPVQELEIPKGADLKKGFPIGTVLKAAITEIRGDGRIRLSAKSAAQEEERAEARSWMQSQQGPKKGFGTLGDLLKQKTGG